MLTNSEKRLVRRIYLWPKLGTYFLLSIFAALAAWTLLVMVDDIALESRGSYDLAMYLAIGFVILYVVASLVMSLWPLFAVRRSSWEEVLKKTGSQPTDTSIPGEIAAGAALGAGGRALDALSDDRDDSVSDALQVAGGALAIAGFARLMGQVHDGARRVADAAGLSMPSLTPYRLAIPLVPVLAIALAFVPRLISSANVMSEAQTSAAGTTSALEAAFEAGGCGYVSSDDPLEHYQSYGYDVTGYTLDIGDPRSSRLTVSTNEDGVVEQVSFTTDIVLAYTPEQNLARAEGDLTRLYAMIAGVSVPVVSPALLGWEPHLPAEFVTQFEEGSYYDEFYVFDSSDDGLRVYTRFDTDPEEEYDEYSSSSIYLSVERED